MRSLWVEFIGEVHEVEDTLSFGRRGDIVLDDANQFMHRVVGVFLHTDDTWWLENRGSRSQLVLFGSDGTRVDLAPGSRVAVSMVTGTVSFIAGPTPYQLTFTVDRAAAVETSSELSGELTMEFGTPLTPREREYLVSFARHRIMGQTGRTPSYAEVAQMWGVSAKTVENTVSRVRLRSREAGVRIGTTIDEFLTHLLSHGRLGLADLLAIETAHPEVFA